MMKAKEATKCYEELLKIHPDMTDITFDFEGVHIVFKDGAKMEKQEFISNSPTYAILDKMEELIYG